MKKALFILSMILTFSFGASAQQLVSVSGTVVGPDGAGVPNMPLLAYYDICGDSAVATIITGAQGEFFFDFGGCSQGIVVLSYEDCNGDVVTVSGSYSPNNYELFFTLLYCANGGGGDCDADFVASTNPASLDVYFWTDSLNVPVSYFWDFGDNQVSTEANPVHTYAQGGNYTVCLTLTTVDGESCTECQEISVGGIVIDSCGVFYEVWTDGLTANFSGFATGETFPPFAYSWDLGDGATATGQEITYSYNAEGQYLVCLTMTDATGCTADYCDWISIWTDTTGNCVSDFWFFPGQGGLDLSFIPADQGNPGSSYFWDFGDGQQSTEIWPYHQYSLAGVYTVCLTVTTADGLSCTSCQTIVLEDNPDDCSVSFDYVVQGTTASFFSSVTGTPFHEYYWDFGDNQGSNEANPTHTYAQSGLYLVCLTIADSSGCAATYCDSLWLEPVNQPNSICGTVTADNNFADHAIVYLIEHDADAGTLTLVDSVSLVNAGYCFTGMADGDYLVKAALTPASPVYSNFVPTYFVNSLVWAFGVPVSVNNSTSIANINLIAGNNPGGPGFVGGLISEGANFAPGDPLSGIQVMLLNMDDTPVQYAYSDENGLFSFENVAYGTYKVYTEVVGLPTTPGIVTIGPDQEMIDNILVEVHSTEVTTTVIVTTSISGPENDHFFVRSVYPNPATISSNITIQSEEAGNLEISLTDILGQFIRRDVYSLQVGENRLSIPLADQNSGLYFLNLSFNGELVGIHKLIRD